MACLFEENLISSLQSWDTTMRLQSLIFVSRREDPLTFTQFLFFYFDDCCPNIIVSTSFSSWNFETTPTHLSSRLYILKKVNSLGLRQGSQVKLLLLQHQEEILDRDEDVTTLKDDPDDSLLSSTAPYPINSLRNIVISMTDTDFILMIDADFQVSPGLDQDFMTYLSNKSSTTDKTAFVIPAFEYLDTPKVIPLWLVIKAVMTDYLKRDVNSREVLITIFGH